jgi:trans-aconitate methyltransferase
MTNQNWNPGAYEKHADFVPVLGKPVIELLAPKIGEKILDLGCGNGSLTKELADAGFDVIGVDASQEMVEAARAKGVHAMVENAEHLDFHEEFDAVMSNAALHWMSDQYGVVRGVWNALKPGGRFAAECGGEGCVRIIREGMKIALIKRNIDYKARNPWKYPELGPFQDILENQGFKVTYIARLDRPTPLPNGLRGWLEVFSESHTKGFSDAEKEKFYGEVEDYCRPFLYDEKTGVWVADYVRLRFLALKPGR